MSGPVFDYLHERQQSSSSEISAMWATIEEKYTYKLWHQLTEILLDFMKSPELSTGDQLIIMYHSFIVDFKHRINAYSYVEICSLIVQQISSYEDAMSFLIKAKGDINADNEDYKESLILCDSTIATIKLNHAIQLQMVKNNEVDIKVIIKEVQNIIKSSGEALDELDSVKRVHSRFYEVSSNYFRLIGDYSEYYKNALRFLGCVDLSTLSLDEKKERAYNLAIAALLGEDTYNFGELLQHEIFQCLPNTEHDWLYHLLFAFNTGNLVKFYEMESQWKSVVDLANNEHLLRSKMCLLCLIEMAFKRPSNDRELNFADIAREAKIPENEVELLAMKALSVGLIRGSINQMSKKVRVDWVQPRVLDKSQLIDIKNKLNQWCEDVRSMENLVKHVAADILT